MSPVEFVFRNNTTDKKGKYATNFSIPITAIRVFPKADTINVLNENYFTLSKVLTASLNLLDFSILLYILSPGYPTRRNTDGY